MSPLLRFAARPYLWLYDLAMLLGPKRGAVALGYGPVLVFIALFLLKSQVFDPWMDPDTATVVLFLAFALTGPLMHVGTRMVAENMQRGRSGQWPASADPRFDRFGEVGPTRLWVEVVREWVREG